MKYLIQTPIDEQTPIICLHDHERIVEKPIVHDTGDPEKKCRCFSIELLKELDK